VERVVDVVCVGDLAPAAGVAEVRGRQGARRLPLEDVVDRRRQEEEAGLHLDLDPRVFLEPDGEGGAHRRAVAQEHREPLVDLHQNALEGEQAHREHQDRGARVWGPWSSSRTTWSEYWRTSAACS
jgi:hypothetical protein